MRERARAAAAMAARASRDARRRRAAASSDVHFGAQLDVVAARALDVGRALARRQLHRLGDDAP